MIVVVTLVALVEMVVRPIGERWARDQAALIELTAKTWVELPPVARPFFELELAANHAIIVTEDVRMLDPLAPDFTYADLLQTALSERLNRPVTLMEGEEMIWVTVNMGDHQLQFGFDESSIDANVMLAVLVIVALMAGIVFLTSFVLVRRIARPLVQVSPRLSRIFAAAAALNPLPEKGPRELLRLVRSFNIMAAEVSELLSSRDALLAGISHRLAHAAYAHEAGLGTTAGLGGQRGKAEIRAQYGEGWTNCLAMPCCSRGAYARMRVALICAKPLKGLARTLTRVLCGLATLICACKCASHARPFVGYCKTFWRTPDGTAAAGQRYLSGSAAAARPGVLKFMYKIEAQASRRKIGAACLCRSFALATVGEVVSASPLCASSATCTVGKWRCLIGKVAGRTLASDWGEINLIQIDTGETHSGNTESAQ